MNRRTEKQVEAHKKKKRINKGIFKWGVWYYLEGNEYMLLFFSSTWNFQGVEEVMESDGRENEKNTALIKAGSKWFRGFKASYGKISK